MAARLQTGRVVRVRIRDVQHRLAVVPEVLDRSVEMEPYSAAAGSLARALPVDPADVAGARRWTNEVLHKEFASLTWLDPELAQAIRMACSD